MAALGHEVDPDGGGDYVSLFALEAAQQQDLTDGGGDTYTATCTSSGGTADTTAVSFIGWTTGAATYIEIKAKAGDEAIKTSLDVARYRITDTLTFSEDYGRIEDLQSATTNNFNNGIYFTGIGAANDLRVSNCRVRADVAGTEGILINDNDATVSIWNTIVEATGNYANSGISVLDGSANIYNCVIYGFQTDGILLNANSDTIVIKNCIIGGNGDDLDDGGAASLTLDYCVADDADARGANGAGPSGGAWGNEIAGSPDYTLQSGGNCEGGGTDNPGAGLYSTDIDGDAYTSPWSIGVDAKTAAGGIVVLRRRRAS
jgi:hypothetical protein